ncbi:MAG: GAF domain-containing protein [Nitriliruptorales bacterium]|nr:GAF domain-containing protein [Nitriliruptorales bacterium]
MIAHRGGTATSTLTAMSPATRGMTAASAPPELPAWLDAIGEIARAVNRSLPLAEILELIAATTARLTGYDFCAVLLEDPEGESLLIKGSFGLSPKYVAEINARSPIMLRPGGHGEGPSSRAFRSQRPVALLDIHEDPTCLPWEGVASEQGYSSILSVPLVAAHAPIGLLNCYTAQAHAFSPHEIILMETIANQAAVAIESTHLRTREQSRIAELVRLNEALDAQRSALQRAEEVHRELMRVLLDGADLPEIATALARTMLCTIVVEDAHGAMLATSHAADTAQAPPSAHTDDPIVAAAILEAIDGRQTVAVPAAADSGDHDSLLTPIVLEREVAGRLWACRPATPFGPFDRRSFERGAIVLALRMLHTRIAQEVESRLSRDVIDDLLNPDAPPSEGIVERARQLGMDLSVSHVVLIARPDPAPAQGALLRMPDAGRTHRGLLSAVQRSLERKKVAALAAARGDDVVVLWPDVQGASPAAELAEDLQREIRAYAAGWTASVAVGPSCTRVSEYADAYRLATGALDLVQESGRRGHVVSLGDLGVYRLLLQVKRPAELAHFAQGVLGVLHDYDERRETSLAQTLRAYLDAQCNAADAAAALNVHVNTVAYRLRRVQELLRIDLRSPTTLVEVEFAFMVERILGHRA